jgi:anaerobic selenocysteine-containing dehydrogenase
MISRREFSKYCLATGAAALGSTTAWAASASPASAEPQTDQMCDLLVKGGTVIDPGQRLHAPMDVAVKEGKILEVSADIPESRARQVVSALPVSLISMCIASTAWPPGLMPIATLWAGV